jgi:hypothetical protein
MTHRAALRRAVGVRKRVRVNPASESNSYVVATVRALLCTLARLAVLVVAPRSATNAVVARRVQRWALLRSFRLEFEPS